MTQKTGSNTKVSRKQERIIQFLISESTIEDAAEKAGVAPVTIYRLLKKPEFKAEYRETKREVFGQAITLLQRESAQAARTLIEMLVDKKVPAAVRVTAACAILRCAREGVEIEDLSDRLEAIEAIMVEKKNEHS
jgi:hypothetical protein